MEAAETTLDTQKRILSEAGKKGTGASLKAYLRLSGPGWLQSAITLGGGSLAGALFLGVLGGYQFLWLQMLAIALGVTMLGAISYVVLSTGERPFAAINRHISPVLGWAWAAASLMANIVWCLPQYSLSVAAARQNLLPGLLGGEGFLGETGSKLAVAVLLWATAAAIVLTYGRQGRGSRFFDAALKAMVALIVLCFIGVVVKMTFSAEGLPWGEILGGFVPSLSQWSEPSPALTPLIQQVAPQFQGFWEGLILSMQRDVMIAAASAAVGINMTFLLPYSLLTKGWGKEFRGFAIFDLVLGMALPFVLVTSCVVIAAASQFHAKPGTGLLEGTGAPKNLVGQYNGLLTDRLKAELGPDFPSLSKEEVAARVQALPEADKVMAATLVKRDAFNLAETLAPLTGPSIANIVFGLGVFGMGLSTIIMLMLISGFVITEVFGLPQGGRAHKLGAMIPTLGVLGPFVWSGKIAFWLAVPTSIFGMVLLPVAYITFLVMMNSRRILGAEMPEGGRRLRWNLLMAVAVSGAVVGSLWSIWDKTGWYGFLGVAVFVAAIFATRRK
jgi:Mn2+/Fe2+ NRAMP family transporter